jgi:hypothetical protein
MKTKATIIRKHDHGEILSSESRSARRFTGTTVSDWKDFGEPRHRRSLSRIMAERFLQAPFRTSSSSHAKTEALNSCLYFHMPP